MTKDQLKTLGEKFIELSGMFIKFIERHGLDETRLNMMEPDDKRKEEVPLCKTPLCHGGWLAVMFEEEGLLQHMRGECFYLVGAFQVAEFLLFSGKAALVGWAAANPELWDNRYGEHMFTDSIAFGEYNPYQLTLTAIAGHYASVGKRCIAKAQSGTSNGGGTDA